MKSKKLLGIFITAVISISTMVPAFADEITSEGSTAIGAEQVIGANNLGNVSNEKAQARKQEIAQKLSLRAQKLGVDITGLTNEQAREKIQLAKAAKLGIDITGLSKEDAKAKVKEAIEGKKQEITQKLLQRATTLGVDITGLDNKTAREKIRQAEALKLGVDITGLSKDEAKAKIKAAVEARKQAATEKITERAAKFGVDITGLSNKEAREKIKAVKEEAKTIKNVK